MEYHLAIHLSGSSGKDLTLLDLQNLKSFFTRIDVKKYVMCIEPAKRDHLHAVYELKTVKPNIKRDILSALRIESKKYPNNAVYNKRLKIGQKFNILAGGYLMKNYKHIYTHNVSHEELVEGKQQYEQIKERKTIRVTKQNIARIIYNESKKSENKELKFRELVIKLFRDKSYNWTYTINKFTETELKCLVYWEGKEDDYDDMYYEKYFKSENNYIY